MSLISFNYVGEEINQDLIIKLSDTVGVGSFTIKDANNFPIFKVDSKGNVKFKGKQQRI